MNRGIICAGRRLVGVGPVLVDVVLHSNSLCESFLLDTKNKVWVFAPSPSLTAATDCNFDDGRHAVDEAVIGGRFGTNNLTYLSRRSQQVSNQALRIAAVTL